MYTASWDRMVRIVDLEANKVTKSFIASKEAIKTMIVANNYVFVAGCDPIIRGFNLEVRAFVRRYLLDSGDAGVPGPRGMGVLPHGVQQPAHLGRRRPQRQNLGNRGRRCGVRARV